jgi:anti-sigma regulatory factor (Ser/Thr protein kinase)
MAWTPRSVPSTNNSRVPFLSETLTVRADLAELSRVNAWLALAGARLALPAGTIFALDLCLEEAVSNIIRYGLKAAPPERQTVQLTMSHEATLLRLMIEDHGPAFDPTQAPDPELPTQLEDAAIGGLGIHLMRRFAQSMRYQRQDGINKLILDFPLA